MAQVKMPHPGHAEHLCFLENIGYLKSPEHWKWELTAKRNLRGW